MGGVVVDRVVVDGVVVCGALKTTYGSLVVDVVELSISSFKICENLKTLDTVFADYIEIKVKHVHDKNTYFKKYHTKNE